MLAESKKSEKYNELLKKAIKQVQAKGYHDIKTKLSGFDDPNGFSQKKEDNEYIPDITAVNNKGKNYFEIAEKTKDVTKLVSKWKLLATIAAMKNGQFTILVPYGQNKFTEELVEKHNINARLVRLD